MLRAERQSARMSKITNDSLTRSGTVIVVYRCVNGGRQRVNTGIHGLHGLQWLNRI